LCSIAETDKYCEVLYGLPPILIPTDKENIAKRFSALTDQLKPRVPFDLSYRDENSIREIPAYDWHKASEFARDRIASYIISISILPLIYQNEPDSALVEVGKVLLTHMSSIFNFIGQSEPKDIDKGITVGSGCIEAVVGNWRIMFNSGWYLKMFEKGWSCRWAGKR
jgi:hypothetical protein